MAGTCKDRLVSELQLADAGSMEEAGRVPWEFLPLFNRRFGVQGAEPGSTYSEVPEELRWPAKNNTVAYHGKSLHLFPDVHRTSYARARIEVNERLDGSLVVCCRKKPRTPAQASPLAAELRKRSQDIPWLPVDPWPPDATRERRRTESKPKTPLGWEGEWYLDDGKRRTHRELVLAGLWYGHDSGASASAGRR